MKIKDIESHTVQALVLRHLLNEHKFNLEYMTHVVDTMIDSNSLNDELVIEIIKMNPALTEHLFWAACGADAVKQFIVEDITAIMIAVRYLFSQGHKNVSLLERFFKYGPTIWRFGIADDKLKDDFLDFIINTLSAERDSIKNVYGNEMDLFIQAIARDDDDTLVKLKLFW